MILRQVCVGLSRSARDKIRYFVALALIIILLSQTFVFAQTGTQSAQQISPTVSIEDKNIKNLKEKIATKVAELREKNNKAVSGFVTAISGLTIKIKDENDVEYDIKLDDALTKYSQIIGTQKKEIKLSDIKKETFVIVTGVANDKIINANIVYVDEMFLVKSGKITQVDSVNFSLKVLSSDKDSYMLDVETTTKQQMINVKTLEAERVGFSKIKEGDTIHFVVKKTGQENPPAGGNTYTAIKILIIPQEYFLK